MDKVVELVIVNAFYEIYSDYKLYFYYFYEEDSNEEGY